MKKVDLLFERYGESHQNHTNEFIHWVCVPLIFFSILGLLSLIRIAILQVETVEISLISLIVILLVTVYYMRLSFIIGFIMFIAMISVQLLIEKIDKEFTYAWLLYLMIFAISWVFQFIGHKIEGKKPSFLTDIFFLLIGPIWLLHFVLKKLRIKY